MKWINEPSMGKGIDICGDFCFFDGFLPPTCTIKLCPSKYS